MTRLVSSLLRPRNNSEQRGHDLLVHTDVNQRQAVLVELQVGHGTLATSAGARFATLFNDTFSSVADPPAPPLQVSTLYLQCRLRPDELIDLLAADAAHGVAERTIYRVWPDYIVRPHIDRSAATVQADAALRTFGASGRGCVWAVIDSGIDGTHPHFLPVQAGKADNLHDPRVADLHRDFTALVSGPDADGSAPQDAGAVRSAKDLVPQDPAPALVDDVGHGTHVAGIIAGSAPPAAVIMMSRSTPDGLPEWTPRELDPGRSLAGLASEALLVSLKVLNNQEHTLSSAVIAALNYVRAVNSYGRNMVIHGVNLSLGCDWYPGDFAAGQSPLCREIDLLVGSGVVVVVSAGNGGDARDDNGDFYGRLSTITDPGNAAKAITVGSTHRDQPHVFGVSYTSSKGPTLDGRLKPDLVAPGERITSAAAGKTRSQVPGFKDATAPMPCYVEDSGTSMAAPHVSGAIAAFLSARPEFIGKPEVVKDLFMQNASSLGRHPFFQGSGLVDLMRVLNSI
ncbi:serine peptidase [Pseudarthrobacter sp. AG30]|uniref:S8 family serine peptidase n=1 Tax=Pseudarthrobacter sp. AG30 TaxID=2249742 RepID=UPI000D64BFEF|nr:S8 family serine peptidase [Pseudarthrobacter sp. AG30]RAX18142.1 serine peptidase [Pseudarthrobacter sp. AG30]